MKTYEEFKDEHGKKLNSFEGIFYAFSDDQFNEGMQKIGLAPDELKAICSIGNGGYMLKTRRKDFHEMVNSFDADMSAMRKDRKCLLEALTYELKNHEFGYTGDASDALDSLGIKYNEVPGDIMKKAMRAAQ